MVSVPPSASSAQPQLLDLLGRQDAPGVRSELDLELLVAQGILRPTAVARDPGLPYLAMLELKALDPYLDVRLETTLHHVALTYENYKDQRGKVNPPIRAASDVDALWRGVARGEIDWICSDHACCSEEHKEGDLWQALPGFGGTALIYPFILTEGPKHGLSLLRCVELVATNPARLRPEPPQGCDHRRCRRRPRHRRYGRVLPGDDRTPPLRPGIHPLRRDGTYRLAGSYPPARAERFRRRRRRREPAGTYLRRPLTSEQPLAAS